MITSCIFLSLSFVVNSKLERSSSMVEPLSNVIAVATRLIFFEFLSQSVIISITSAAESPSPTSVRPLRKIPGKGISWDIQRKDNYHYADNSVYLVRLLENERGNIFFCVTRPRRFGKSSFLANCFFQRWRTSVQWSANWPSKQCPFFQKTFKSRRARRTERSEMDSVSCNLPRLSSDRALPYHAWIPGSLHSNVTRYREILWTGLGRGVCALYQHISFNLPTWI